ncbi:DUF2180 family protein [Amycolatopsis sp. NPDC049253]|uniref:DUF2180 family protein n=1 Tax=Amycolatopsis sp. NPDC049253 TaxID=3155274 RepID=UPI00343962E2
MTVIDQPSSHLGSRTLSAEELDRIAHLDVLGLADGTCDVMSHWSRTRTSLSGGDLLIVASPAVFSRRTMICIDCATQGMSEPAVGVCVHCGAGTCLVHVAIQTLPASAPGVVARRQAGRMITCAHCGEPRTTRTRARYKATAIDR